MFGWSNILFVQEVLQDAAYFVSALNPVVTILTIRAYRHWARRRLSLVFGCSNGSRVASSPPNLVIPTTTPQSRNIGPPHPGVTKPQRTERTVTIKNDQFFKLYQFIYSLA
jgi:hypothetical protein